MWVKPEPHDAKAVYAALKSFGAPLSNISEDDFADEGLFYQMGVPPVRVDILMSIPGLDFETAWQEREEVNFDGIVLTFISKKHLIVSKRASGRQQDLLDAETLENCSD